MKLYQKIAQAAVAIENCKKSNNTEWQYKHEDILTDIERNYLPHGSGFDGDMEIVSANDKKIQLVFDWHCMNDNGYYDGWLRLNMIITPSLSNNFNLKIKFYNNKNDQYKVRKYKPLIENFLYDEFNYVLTQEYKDGKDSIN